MADDDDDSYLRYDHTIAAGIPVSWRASGIEFGGESDPDTGDPIIAIKRSKHAHILKADVLDEVNGERLDDGATLADTLSLLTAALKTGAPIVLSLVRWAEGSSDENEADGTSNPTVEAVGAPPPPRDTGKAALAIQSKERARQAQARVRSLRKTAAPPPPPPPKAPLLTSPIGRPRGPSLRAPRSPSSARGRSPSSSRTPSVGRASSPRAPSVGRASSPRGPSLGRLASPTARPPPAAVHDRLHGEGGQKARRRHGGVAPATQVRPAQISVWTPGSSTRETCSRSTRSSFQGRLSP